MSKRRISPLIVSPLSIGFETKFFMKNDLIEIAISSEQLFSSMEHIDQDTAPLSDDDIILLLEMIYQTNEPKLDSFDGLFPLSVYKLLIGKNKIELFERLVFKEMDNDRFKVCSIILESFTYAVNYNNMIVAFYLLVKYAKIIYQQTDNLTENESMLRLIDTLLNNINEYTEINGNYKYQFGVDYFEEKLFILEMVSNYFSFDQAKHFIKICEKLATVHIPDDHSGNKYRSTYLTYFLIKNNFACFCVNPVKFCVLVLNMIIILEEKYSVLVFMSEHVKDMYCNIANLILEATENIDEVERMLKDDCYNCYTYKVANSPENSSTQKFYSGKEVIDILAQRNILKILNNSKVGELINSFWKGKYERENFL